MSTGTSQVSGAVGNAKIKLTGEKISEQRGEVNSGTHSSVEVALGAWARGFLS